MTTTQNDRHDDGAASFDPVLNPKFEKYGEANKVVIEYPRMMRALKKVEDCRQMSKGAREPECMLIIGQPGVGKTTIKDHYLSQHPRQETKAGTHVPVLAATIPVPAKMSTMATALLAGLGDPLAAHGALDAKTLRLYKLVKDCGVELIILDEFQHFIDRDNDRVLRSVADWLKNLITETKKPVVLTGLPCCRKVLEANEQLRRRFSCQLNVNAFSWRAPGRPEFRKFLALLQRSLPLESAIDFSDEEMAKRFYHASHGRVGALTKIAKGAVFIALEKGEKRISQEMLAQSFADRLLPQEDRGRRKDDPDNPFHAGWEHVQKQAFAAIASKHASKPKAASGRSKKQVRQAAAEVFRAG
ncbi:TniB family NTP-binding protein [Kordiimonas marina]|uniref:TniB family NTP-binding protein n=1 Tax=Kordiimonas marina TaxID=2872312 RepID=UPI001FF4A50A|nr:TniB family NTP-binding protein [Kordiimonas marina]MCJ9430024.1 TniB family NTP-binding protein [Kordiimonas marina]